MFKTLRLLLVCGFVGISLGGCQELAEYFTLGDPADVSSCEFVEGDLLLGENELCAQCDSGGPATTAKATNACGLELSVRCNEPSGRDLYGIAIATGEGSGTALVGTAWIDSDYDGADDDDEVVCHQQAGALLGKQEVKCTTALKGNGKTGAYTFEAEVKYDASKDTGACDPI